MSEINDRKRERKRALLCAEILAEQWGICEDADFTIGCAGCLASHVRRCMLDEPTPNGDKAFQAAMQAEEAATASSPSRTES